MDGWMDGWMDRYDMYIYICVCVVYHTYLSQSCAKLEFSKSPNASPQKEGQVTPDLVMLAAKSWGPRTIQTSRNTSGP